MSLERVRQFLNRFDSSLEPVVFAEKMNTSQEAADALGCEVGQIAKSILFRSGEAFGLFVTAGDVRVDLKVVKNLLGRDPKMAAPEVVLQMTGFPIGAVCPYALATDMPIFIDQSLDRFDVVYTGAGIAESLLPIRFDQLVKLENSQVVDLAKR